MSLIHKAAEMGDVETLRRLLSEGVSPDTPDDCIRSPLHCLRSIPQRNDTADGLAACFQLLHDAGASLDAVDLDGHTPLHYAAYVGSAKMMSLLLEAGANVNATSYIDCTALHWAANVSDKRATDCVDVLLARGASVNARDRHGRTPFDMPLPHNRRHVWPLLLRAGAEIPTDNTDPYFVRVRNAGGFKKYEQQHLGRITSILAPTPRLPPEMVRKIVEFWLHAGFY